MARRGTNKQNESHTTPKCTLMSPKTRNGEIGKEKNFCRKKTFSEQKNFFSEFFLPNILFYGTGQRAGSTRMPILHLESIFDDGGYSRNLPTQRYLKNMAKTRFLTLANPTLKSFLGGSTGGRWCKCNANGPHSCVGHAKKWSRIRSECPQVQPTRRNEKSNVY